MPPPTSGADLSDVSPLKSNPTCAPDRTSVEKFKTPIESPGRDSNPRSDRGSMGQQMGDLCTGGIASDDRVEQGTGEALKVRANQEMPPENSGEELRANPEMPAKKTVGKTVGNSQDQQVTGIYPRTEWFRPELDFRKAKKGYAVLIRKRLRWSDERYSHTILKRNCPQLTPKMVEQIRSGKFTDAAVAALVQGGISHGFIKQLFVRIGKGNGRRRTDLGDNERSILARIERGLAASRRRQDDCARGDNADNVQVLRERLQDSSDDDASSVPYVH